MIPDFDLIQTFFSVDWMVSRKPERRHADKNHNCRFLFHREDGTTGSPPIFKTFTVHLRRLAGLHVSHLAIGDAPTGLKREGKKLVEDWFFTSADDILWPTTAYGIP